MQMCIVVGSQVCQMLCMGTHKAVKIVTWRYPALESALARALGVDEAGQAGWFRGRIGNLRRLGFAPVSGRGKVVNFDRSWATRWYLALLLTVRFGRDPGATVKFISEQWERPTSRRRTADVSGWLLSDVAAEARAAVRIEDHVIVTIDLASEAPVVGLTTVRGMGSLGHWIAELGAMLVLFDMTLALRALDSALGAVTEKDDLDEAIRNAI